MRSFGNQGRGAVRSRRCSDCSIQYPPFVEVCRICGDPTWPMYKNPPDPDWEARVAQSLGEGVYLDPPVAFTVPHPVDVRLPMHVVDGRMWLSHAGLIEAGYKYLEDGSVVLVNGRFYELLGHLDRGNLWWVEELVTEGAFKDATPEDVINGG